MAAKAKVERFRAELQLGGKTATGIEVPAEVVEALGSGRKPAVSVTFASHTYRTTVFPRRGVYMVPVSSENREAAGVAAGDVLDVAIALDTAPREVDVPAELAEALAAEPGLGEAFEGMSFTQRKEMARSVTEAKKPETKVRRLEKAKDELRRRAAKS